MYQIIRSIKQIQCTKWYGFDGCCRTISVTYCSIKWLHGYQSVDIVNIFNRYEMPLATWLGNSHRCQLRHSEFIRSRHRQDTQVLGTVGSALAGLRCGHMCWHRHGDTKVWLVSHINNLELMIQITIKIYNKRSRLSASRQAGGCAKVWPWPMSPKRFLMPQGALSI